MTNWEELKKAAEDFYDENMEITAPFDYAGITGTSIGYGPEGIGIIVHINGSQRIFDLIPNMFRDFFLYKKFER